MNRNQKVQVNGEAAPTRNDEYLFYQTLVGVWPFDGREAVSEQFRSRVRDYMLKAVREGKAQTSWANQNKEYESAVTNFVDNVLNPELSRSFLSEFSVFERYVARIGMYNSLSQTLIKLTAPGVPDIYQGTELWDFSLVDPDNRRPVDYEQRQGIISEILEGGDRLDRAKSLSETMQDGRIKLFLTSTALSARKLHKEIFLNGSYVPLSARGTKSPHVISFARVHEKRYCNHCCSPPDRRAPAKRLRIGQRSWTVGGHSHSGAIAGTIPQYIYRRSDTDGNRRESTLDVRSQTICELSRCPSAA